jgi:hypothetical protein
MSRQRDPHRYDADADGESRFDVTGHVISPQIALANDRNAIFDFGCNPNRALPRKLTYINCRMLQKCHVNWVFLPKNAERQFTIRIASEVTHA